jgi:hypothetical protein
MMQPGVDVEISKTQKDELIIMGNSLESVSQSAADIQQACRVRSKDIRKVGNSNPWRLSRPEALLMKGFILIDHSSWTACTSRRRATLKRPEGV